MDNVFSDWDWDNARTSFEVWEEPDALIPEEDRGVTPESENNNDISVDDINNLIFTLDGGHVREKEQELLNGIIPHHYKASSDIWNSFYLRIPKLDSGKDFRKEKEAVPRPQQYEVKQYPVSRPVFEEIEKIVAKEAASVIKSFKFWQLKSLRDDYVGDNTYPRYKEAVQKWESDKAYFDKQELENQAEFNAKAQAHYIETIHEIEERERAYLHPNPAGIQKQIEKDLKELSLPYAIAIAFAYSSGHAFVDVLYSDRYEIIPSEFVTRTRTQTEENLRYLDVILGCAFQIAATTFNASQAVLSVNVIGHAKSFSTSDSAISDSNLYAVSFDRASFTRDFSVIRYFSPYERLTHYLHLLEVSKRYIITPIKVKKAKRLDALSFTTLHVEPIESLGEDENRPSIKLDDRFEEAAKMVVAMQRASASELQRRLGMGFSKTGYVLDQLETAGIVGPQEGSRPRQVYVSDLRELEGILRSLKK